MADPQTPPTDLPPTHAIQQLLELLAARLSAQIPDAFGFTLLIYETGIDQPSVFYVSSASTPDMIRVLDAFKALLAAKGAVPDA